jgi:hypothetical protein
MVETFIAHLLGFEDCIARGSWHMLFPDLLEIFNEFVYLSLPHKRALKGTGPFGSVL